MAADDSSSPLDRIDLALARLEAAAAALPGPQPLPLPMATTPDADLVRRHEALRASVADAITSLDQLLAKDSG